MEYKVESVKEEKEAKERKKKNTPAERLPSAEPESILVTKEEEHTAEIELSDLIVIEK